MGREQILRELIFNVQQERDYRDIFSSRETFVNRDLGYLYNIPVRPEEGWARIEMPEGSGRAGILSNAGFLALHSHPGRSEGRPGRLGWTPGTAASCGLPTAAGGQFLHP